MEGSKKKGKHDDLWLKKHRFQVKPWQGYSYMLILQYLIVWAIEFAL
jgi:hypothetical protein